MICWMIAHGIGAGWKLGGNSWMKDVIAPEFWGCNCEGKSVHRHGQLFVDAIEESRAALKTNGSEWVRMNGSIMCGIIERSKSGTEMNVSYSYSTSSFFTSSSKCHSRMYSNWNHLDDYCIYCSVTKYRAHLHRQQNSYHSRHQAKALKIYHSAATLMIIKSKSKFKFRLNQEMTRKPSGTKITWWRRQPWSGTSAIMLHSCDGQALFDASTHHRSQYCCPFYSCIWDLYTKWKTDTNYMQMQHCIQKPS